MKSHQTKNALRWALTIAYAGGIFYLSSRHWSGVPSFPYIDKIAHVGLYGGLGALCFWSLRGTRALPLWKLFLTAVVLTTLYGLSDEFHQMFVPGRGAELGDLISDAAGGTLGALLALWAGTRADARERGGT